MHDDFMQQSQALADEFAAPGSLKYRLLQMGFMPHDETDAVELLRSLLAQADDELRDNYGLTRGELPGLPGPTEPGLPGEHT